MIAIYIYSFVLVTALVAALVAQWRLPPHRRTRIIFAAAGAPTLLLMGLAVQFGILQGGIQALVGLIFIFLTSMFVGLFGAIIGSELASLVRWLWRRRG